jgi:hypothetical protein
MGAIQLELDQPIARELEMCGDGRLFRLSFVAHGNSDECLLSKYTRDRTRP